MSGRARRRSEVGSATVLGLGVLLALYIGASIISCGVMDYADLIAAPKPATISVFEYMAPGWGFLLLACLGYLPGFFFYKKARQEAGESLAKCDWIFIAVFALLAVVSIPLTAAGIIAVF